MNWWGKVIGGALGFAVGGPIGALIGVAIGHGFDGKSPLDWRDMSNADAGRVQTVFFTTVFSVMGHLAKSDGRVSEREIAMARAVMAHMNLQSAQAEAAMRLFSEGKRPDFPLDEVLAQFKRECRLRRDLFITFLEIQLQAALADGEINADERQVLRRICAALGMPEAVLRQLEALLRMQQQRSGPGGAARPQRDLLADAYQVLGVTPAASDAEVKRAYRKLMSQHHPDKLVAKGLPEEMLRVAQEKAKDITRAYDLVKEARGMK